MRGLRLGWIDRNPSPGSFGATLSLWERGLCAPALFPPWMRVAHFPRTGEVDGAVDFLHHPIETFVDLGVGEADLQISARFDNISPLPISFHLFGVMHAIQLDRQAQIDAGEVRDEAVDGNLPPEFEALAASAAQLLPEAFQRRR